MAASFVELRIDQVSRGTNVIPLETTGNVEPGLEIKEKLFTETAGGFVYDNLSKLTRNRTIVWKVNENVIILKEDSLDYNLFGNTLEIHISGELILPNVVIKESNERLDVFFVTTNTVHKISFVHPNHEKYGFILPSGINVSMPSVFHNAERSYKHQQCVLTQPCNNFDVCVTTDNDVFFGLSTDAKTLLCAQLTQDSDESSCIELKDSSMMRRLWTGLVPAFVRGDSTWMGVESVVMHCFGDDVFAFTLCKDLKIRVWNIRAQTCIETKDLVSLIPDKLDSQSDIVGSLCLRKSQSSSSGQLLFVAHCCLTYNSQFVIMEAFHENDNIVVVHVSNFFSEFNNIQDISLNSQYVWALWNTSDGENIISYAPIEGGKDYERGWHRVHSKQDEKDDLFVPMFQDAKEVYLERLFAPSSFHKPSLIKALQVFTKTTDQGEELLPDDMSDLLSLKESLIQILDIEVECNVLNRELSSSDYQEIQQQCWSRFYSFYLQCKQAREKAIGLFVDEGNNSTLIIRQDTCGFLYYLDWVDHLYLSDLDMYEGVRSFVDNELDLNGDDISNDILCIFECLKTIPKQFNADIIQGIDNDLDGNEDVKTFLTCMSSVLISNTSDFEQLVGDPVARGDYLTDMEGRLKHLRNPSKAVEIIMSCLESSEFPTTTMFDQSDFEDINESIVTQFLCSTYGVQVLTETLAATSFNRMHLCRDLYILLKFMEKVSCKIGLDLSVAKEFSSLISNSCYELLRSYHTIYWSSKKSFQEIDPSTLDANLTNLASLRLTDRNPSSKTARKKALSQEDDSPVSLLFCFVRDVGVQNSLKYLTESNLNSLKPGDYSNIEKLKVLARACLHELWVLNEKSSDFPEYLVSHCQYCNLNEYLHLCDEWCMVSRGTKDFLLAQSYLGSDQPEKALRYFISAARGISLQEPLLMNLLEGTEENKQDALVHYFIKVMRLFEQFEYPEFVISAASSAITIAKKDDPNVAMLWSVVFKNHMELEHYNEAYAAIIHNNDKTRRNDCLRLFIITLCERGLFQEICSYPYVNLEEEVVSILEARARTMDMTVNSYYDLLYSYHIMKNDYRKASTTMYEQACRLCTEMHGLKSLQKQAKCYLSSLTALKLVDKKYAWIVRPHEKINASPSSLSRIQDYSHSPKRKEDGEEVFHSRSKKSKSHKTKIVEIEDLEKEYLLVLARLKLVQFGKSETIAVGPSLTPSETVGLLSQIGLFDTSFSVAQKFKLSCKNMFESLAGKCASLVTNHVSEFDERWMWLSYNELHSTQLVSAKTAGQLAFLLLQSYLKRFSEKKSSLHMKVVAAKFLSMGCTLPSWLIKDYELTNPAELLHLYICFDMVNEATLLSLKYIDAVLGVGKEYLGLNTALHATTPAVWLPYTSFDQLLTALRANFENPESAKLCEQLQDKLNDYFNQLEGVTCDKVDYLYQLGSRLT